MLGILIEIFFHFLFVVAVVSLCFFFQTFVNEMRISQQPVDLKLKDNIRFGYDILLKIAVNLDLLFLLIARLNHN